MFFLMANQQYQSTERILMYMTHKKSLLAAFGYLTSLKTVNAEAL